MLFKQFRQKAKERKDRIRADREVASRVMEDLDKKDKKSGFDWKSFLFGSKQKKQHVTKQCTQTVDETKRELAMLKEEANKEYQDVAERASKKAELLKELAALRARVIKREKMVQQIDLQQDASQEYLVDIKKQINELEEFLDSTEADIEQSKQAGPDGSIFFLVGKSTRDLQNMTELGSPEAIREIKDKHSYEFIDYFVTGGVELNDQCAAAIQGTDDQAFRPCHETGWWAQFGQAQGGHCQDSQYSFRFECHHGSGRCWSRGDAAGGGGGGVQKAGMGRRGLVQLERYHLFGGGRFPSPEDAQD